MDTNVIRKENCATKEPVVCVDCGSSDIAAGYFENEGDGFAWREVECQDCHVTWIENFKFIDWEYK